MTEDLFVAWQSFAVELPDRTSPMIVKGTRLRGDDPAYQACPDCFAPHGSSRQELAAAARAVDSAAPAPGLES
jgi:hypothetical protein